MEFHNTSTTFGNDDTKTQENRQLFEIGVPDRLTRTVDASDYRGIYIAAFCLCVIVLVIPCGLFMYKRGIKRKTRRLSRRVTLINATLNLDHRQEAF